MMIFIIVTFYHRNRFHSDHMHTVIQRASAVIRRVVKCIHEDSIGHTVEQTESPSRTNRFHSSETVEVG